MSRRVCGSGIRCVHPDGPDLPLSQFPAGKFKTTTPYVSGEKSRLCFKCTYDRRDSKWKLAKRTPAQWDKIIEKVCRKHPRGVAIRIAHIVWWDHAGSIVVSESGHWKEFREKWVEQFDMSNIDRDLMISILLKLGYWNAEGRISTEAWKQWTKTA